MAARILVVDDEAVARDGLARLLAAQGFTVATACDAHEVMRQMAAQPADTVLLDLGLPLVPGDSIAAFLNIRHPRMRIIFISGQYDMVDPERFGENTLYFAKPLDINNLLDTLRGGGPAAASASESLRL